MNLHTFSTFWKYCYKLAFLYLLVLHLISWYYLSTVLFQYSDFPIVQWIKEHFSHVPKESDCRTWKVFFKWCLDAKANLDFLFLNVIIGLYLAVNHPYFVHHGVSWLWTLTTNSPPSPKYSCLASMLWTPS